MNGEVIVEVLDGEVIERAGSFEDDSGKSVAYETRKQEARLEVNGYAYPYKVRLEKGQPAFKPGRYRMALHKMLKINNEAHGINKFPVLEPIAAAAK